MLFRREWRRRGALERREDAARRGGRRGRAGVRRGEGRRRGNGKQARMSPRGGHEDDDRISSRATASGNASGSRVGGRGERGRKESFEGAMAVLDIMTSRFR